MKTVKKIHEKVSSTWVTHAVSMKHFFFYLMALFPRWNLFSYKSNIRHFQPSTGKLKRQIHAGAQ